MSDFIAIHKTGFRLLKMIHSVDSAIIPLHLLEVCLSTIQIYAGLFLTAVLIDLLLKGAYGQAAQWALYLLGMNLFFGVALCLLRRKFRGMRNRIWLIFYVWLREKAFSLDYETMERPEVSEKLLYSERTSEMHGGLGVLLCRYCDILKALLNILLSVGMVAVLCMAGPEKQAGLTGWIAKPLPSALLFGAAFA